MRIYHLNLATGFGGGEVQTLNLLRWQQESSDAPYLVAREGSALAQRASEVIPRQNLLTPAGLLRNVFSLRDPQTLLHAHDGHGLHLAAFVKRLTGVQLVATRRIEKGRPRNLVSRLSYATVDQFVAVSTNVQSRLDEHFSSKRIRLIPDSTSDFASDPAAVALIRERFSGKRLIGQIGSLYPIKGHRYTLEVAARLARELPDVHFLFLGEGDERSALEEQAAGLDNVSFVGFVEDVGNWLAAMDLLVHPSLKEGLGSVLLEALQFGVPVVASSVGGIPDIIQDGKTGQLIPPGDSDALHDAVVRLLDDQQLREHLIAGGKKHLEHFHPDVVGKAYLDLYRQLLNDCD